MADQSASFAVNLEDGTSGAAESAATALQQLRDRIDGDTKALREMQRAMKNLQGGTSVNIKQFRELKERIDTKKQSIAEAQASFLTLGGTFAKVSRGGKGASSAFAQMAQQAQGLGGPLGGLVGRFGALKGLLVGGGISLAIVAIVAALAALTVGTVAATAALLKYGIAQANARRSELHRLEGLTKIRDWYGRTADSASFLQSTIDKVSGSVALGRGQVSQYAEQLYRMGLRAGNLEAALEGVAITAATQGEQQAAMFKAWAAGAAHTGQSVRALADDVKARLGGIAAAQMLDLNVQSQKLRESMSMLFSGVRIEGLLKQLHSVTSLLSQSTATGRALKVIMEALFQPVINSLEYLGPLTKRFFQGMVIGALLITIHLLKVRNWFKKTFGDSEILAGMNAQKAALYAGVFVMGALAGLLVLAATAATVLAVKFGAVGAIVVGKLLLVAAVIASVVYGLAELGSALVTAGKGAVTWIVGAFGRAQSFLKGIDWGDLGASVVRGLVDGIKRGATWVVDAVKNLAGDAAKAFRDKLIMRSPSRVFFAASLGIPLAVVGAVKQQTPAVRAAVNQMVLPPGPIPITVRTRVRPPSPVDLATRTRQPADPVRSALRAPQSAASNFQAGARLRERTPQFAVSLRSDAGSRGDTASPSVGAPITIQVGDIHIHTNSDSPREHAQDFKTELGRILEGVAIQLGGRRKAVG